MLPPAALRIADRLATALMALVEAVASVATAGSSPTLPQEAAQTLLFRLSQLVVRLITISNFGVRAPAAKPASAKPAPANHIPAEPAPETPKPAAPQPLPAPTPRLPRRPGWLLDALPDVAPAVAADLRALLADPAAATLLDTDPFLHRTLRPLLRSLGLDAAPPAAPPTPPAAPPPEPHDGPTQPRPPTNHHLHNKIDPPNPDPFHAQFITIT